MCKSYLDSVGLVLIELQGHRPGRAYRPAYTGGVPLYARAVSYSFTRVSCHKLCQRLEVPFDFPSRRLSSIPTWKFGIALFIYEILFLINNPSYHNFKLLILERGCHAYWWGEDQMFYFLFLWSSAKTN